MAIRFDDRIETNVAGDVLITGNQIAVSDDGHKIEIGTEEPFIFSVGTKSYNFPRSFTSIRKLTDIPSAINNVNNNIFELTSSVIQAAINDLALNISSNVGITINTTDKFFGDSIITSTNELNAFLTTISTSDDEGKPIPFPIIALLSAPIQIDLNKGIVYSTKDLRFPYGTQVTIPKNTLICISTTSSGLPETNVEYNLSTYNVGVLSKRIQILSIPVSADSIHNNFETRIANIESLLALK